MINKRKCLVTGGAGFIGSHLVDLLVEQGHDVVVLDNLSNGRERNLTDAMRSGTVMFHNVNVADLDTIRPLFRGIHDVFHLAALADIVPSIQNPMTYHSSNVDGTISVLEAARAAAVSRFLYAASSSCYGIPDVYPTPEEAEPRPMYPYALTKFVGEQYVMHWNKTYQIPAVALRLFNVYGPRSRTSGTYGAVFGVFLAQKLAGKPYTIVGDGTQTRDFTFVKDVARAFYAAAHSDLSGEIMNVGSGSTYSVNHLVELLGGDVTYLPRRPGEPDCTFADTKRIREKLGWEAETSFETGVRIMLENIEYWRDAPVWESQAIAEATKDWFKYLTPLKEAKRQGQEG